MTEFKKGDLVRHVLGQRMQVKTVHSAKLVECSWFDAHGTPHTEGFLTEDLVSAAGQEALDLIDRKMATITKAAIDDYANEVNMPRPDGFGGGATPGTHEMQGTSGFTPGTHEEQCTAVAYGPRVADDDRDQA